MAFTGELENVKRRKNVLKTFYDLCLNEEITHSHASARVF